MKKVRTSMLVGTVCILSAAAFLLSSGVASRLVSGKGTLRALSIAEPALIPWESIGGCGAGGSGGGGGGAKWVGKGISGGLVDVQLMYSKTIGQNFFNDNLSTRLSVKPSWNMGLGLSVPIVSKNGEMQPRSNQPIRDYITGGLGDLGLDYSYGFGAENEYSLGLAVSLPTGQYDIKRGRDGGQEFLSSSLQKGSGLYSGSLTLSYTKDVAHGLWLIDLGYSNPFNLKIFTGKNQFIDSGEYFYDYRDRKDDPRFYYRAKFYGENDLGDYTPPGVNASVYYGYRGVAGYVHSFGVTFSAPLAVAWMHGEPVNAFNPRPDPDHKPWSATFNYGLEVSRMQYPIFFAVSLPFHATSSPNGSWTAPDMKDFLNQWTFAAGVKSTMF